jgi:hypothetical protein
VEKKASNADTPPADAPMPTIGNAGVEFSGCASTRSGSTGSSGVRALWVVSANDLVSGFRHSILSIRFFNPVERC